MLCLFVYTVFDWLPLWLPGNNWLCKCHCTLYNFWVMLLLFKKQCLPVQLWLTLILYMNVKWKYYSNWFSLTMSWKVGSWYLTVQKVGYQYLSYPGKLRLCIKRIWRSGSVQTLWGNSHCSPDLSWICGSHTMLWNRQTTDTCNISGDVVDSVASDQKVSLLD